MPSYIQQVQVVVEHAYFADGLSRQLTFVPTTATSTLLQQLKWLVRMDGHSLTLFSERNDAAIIDIADIAQSMTDARLCFAVYAGDPNFSSYTDGFSQRDLLPLYFSDAGPDKAILVNGKMPPDASNRGEDRKLVPGLNQGLADPYFYIGISMAVALRAPSTLRVQLAARKYYWKYYFWGDYVGDSIQIVDMNKTLPVISFRKSLQPVERNGYAMVSSVEIPMQEMPEQRFQLKDGGDVGTGFSDGSVGKVLIKRLPNAGNLRFGKETFGDGAQAIVAEIYINQ